MRFLLLFFLLAAFGLSVKGQQNLVPNPSFEDKVYCPTGNNQIDACEHWLNFGNSPDYFNACSNPAFAVPNAVFGFQYAHTGDAYAGVACYLHPNAAPPPNYREFLGVELNNTLVIGQKYFVSFYLVNPGSFNIAIACNKIGINFFTTSFDSCCPPQTLNYSILYTDSIVTDTLNWIKLSGSFIADSAYKFLAIGNFFDDQNTDTINMQPFPYQAYYYVDDVCLSTDSLYNETWTSLIETTGTSNQPIIFPNPSSGFFTINSPIPIDNYCVYNLQGQLILKMVKNVSYKHSIDLSNQAEGLYLIRIQSKYKIYNYKILLTY